MLNGMDESEFGQFVAALWEQQGWQTQVKRNDGRVFVAVLRPETGEEGLLWALPASDDVGGQQVQKFASLCEGYEVEEAAIVAAGSLSDHARKVAKGTGVELLDGDKVEMLLKRKELTHLAEKYGGGSADGSATDADGDGGEAGDGDSPLDQIQAIASQAGRKVSALVSGFFGGGVSLPVSGKPVVIVVVLVALLGAGVLFGPSIPFVGGGGDGPVSAESVAPDNSTAKIHIEWNAKVVDSIDVNESDDKAYYPPEGEEFVIVRMSINNTGEQKIPLKQSAFKLRTEERTYGHQLLSDHDGFLDFPAAPGQHYVGWTVFSVPKGTSGTLVYDQNATGSPVTVEFERNADFPVDVTQR